MRVIDPYSEEETIRLYIPRLEPGVGACVALHCIGVGVVFALDPSFRLIRVGRVNFHPSIKRKHAFVRLGLDYTSVQVRRRSERVQHRKLTHAAGLIETDRWTSLIRRDTDGRKSGQKSKDKSSVVVGTA